METGQPPLRDKLGTFTQSPQIKLPERYQRYSAGKESMFHTDFIFLEKLQEKFDLLPGQAQEQAERVPFGKKEFLDSVADVKEYVVSLRDEDTGFNSNGFDNTIDTTTREGRRALGKYATEEKRRPSTARAKDLIYIFLHLPKVKNIYSQIHAEKMATALRPFAEKLSSADLANTTNLPDFFTQATGLMKQSMAEVVNNRNDANDDDIGLLTGFQEYEYMRPESLRKKDFATEGIDLFSEVLELTINESIDQKQDVRSRLRAEFLDKKGIAPRLMRISLRTLAERTKPDIVGKSLDEAREIVERSDYFSGACPAILKTESLDGSGEERPIAYEYAATITHHIPPQLLRAV